MSYFVSMTDNFMSGWGQAEDKINKYVVECDNVQQAELIFKNAKKRSEMSNVIISEGKAPYYAKDKYLVTNKKYEDLGGAWKDGEVKYSSLDEFITDAEGF